MKRINKTDLLDEENATALFFAYLLAGCALYNHLTNSEVDVLEFHYILNKLIFSHAKVVD